MEMTTRDAGGTNKRLQTKKLPTEGTDLVVTAASDYIYTEAITDLTEGPVLVQLTDVPSDRYFLFRSATRRTTRSTMRFRRAAPTRLFVSAKKWKCRMG